MHFKVVYLSSTYPSLMERVGVRLLRESLSKRHLHAFNNFDSSALFATVKKNVAQY
jgi:hypothetical protein